MTFVPVRSWVWGGAHGYQWCRNGRHPDAQLMTRMIDQANHLGICRLQEYASFCVPIASIPASAAAGADRDRWRFQFHTSPFARYVWTDMVLAIAADDYNPGARLRIVDTGGSTFGDATFYYGSAINHSSDTPDTLGYGKTTLVSAGAALEIDPDTDYRGTFTDVGGGRLVAATVYEWGLQPDTDNGYLPTNYGHSTPVYDEDRYDLAAMARGLWKHQAGKLFLWASDTDAASPTNATTTDTNAIDTSITTISTTTPGFIVDGTYRATRMRTTIPCVFWAYGKCSSSGNGRVYLKNSAGTVLATISGFTTSDGWATTTVSLPATLAKYDVHFEALAGTTTLRAFGLYQYKA